MAWSVVGTQAHEGSKTYRGVTAQRAQHKVAATGFRVAAQYFSAFGVDELHNVLRFK